MAHNRRRRGPTGWYVNATVQDPRPSIKPIFMYTLPVSWHFLWHLLLFWGLDSFLNEQFWRDVAEDHYGESCITTLPFWDTVPVSIAKQANFNSSSTADKRAPWKWLAGSRSQLKYRNPPQRTRIANRSSNKLTASCGRNSHRLV